MTKKTKETQDLFLEFADVDFQKTLEPGVTGKRFGQAIYAGVSYSTSGSQRKDKKSKGRTTQLGSGSNC